MGGLCVQTDGDLLSHYISLVVQPVILWRLLCHQYWVGLPLFWYMAPYIQKQIAESLFNNKRRWLKNKRPTWCHLLFYFTSYVLNMFRTLIYPSPGACDYSVELLHWSYCSWFDVCWSFSVVGLEWYPCCRLKLQPATRIPTHIEPQEQYDQQNNRKLQMMDILMSETCWVH